MDPVVITLGGAVIAYLLYDNRRLKRDNWQLMQAIYENTEAMHNYSEMRKQGGPPA